MRRRYRGRFALGAASQHRGWTRSPTRTPCCRHAALPSWRSLSGTKRLGQAGLMTPELATYPGYRFPAEIIGHAVWLYHAFGLSLRDVELILAERGITVTHESIRRWGLKFGGDFARRLRRDRKSVV